MSLAALGPLFSNAHAWLVLAAPWVAAAALLLALAATLLLLSLRQRLRRLALGRNGSIEESVTILTRDIHQLQTFRGELEKYLKLAESRMRGSLQGVGVVRFNPFSGDGSGGNQSFAVAFLDEKLSGVVLSTLYTRDRVSVYAKPVEGGASTFELTAEEEAAMSKAKASLAHTVRPGA